MTKLLIGYDGSDCAAGAIEDLQHAGLPAQGVEAVVMSIADVWPVMPSTDYPLLYPDAVVRVRDQVDASLDEAKRLALQGVEHVRRLFPGWAVSSETEADSPYWGLVKKAADWGADLLLVGSHGRSAVGRIVFGSVSRNAVLYADCSARIGRCDTERPLAAGQAVRVLVGWDGSPDAALAVAAVAARTWPIGSECRLVSAIHSRLSTRLPEDMKSHGVTDEREYFRKGAQAAAEQLRASGLAVGEPVMEQGDPKRVLLDEAEAWHANCIFVGAKGLSRIERVLMGSVSATVAAKATCTVEVVRAPRKA